MRRSRTPRRPSQDDQHDARRFTLIVALITLAATIILAALIAPGAIPLNVLWPPLIALLTEAVRPYFSQR